MASLYGLKSRDSFKDKSLFQKPWFPTLERLAGEKVAQTVEKSAAKVKYFDKFWKEESWQKCKEYMHSVRAPQLIPQIFDQHASFKSRGGMSGRSVRGLFLNCRNCKRLERVVDLGDHELTEDRDSIVPLLTEFRDPFILRWLYFKDMDPR